MQIEYTSMQVMQENTFLWTPALNWTNKVAQQLPMIAHTKL